MKSKFEQLIGHIINEDEAAAQKVFHAIVVEQSRKIYEDLQDEELGADSLGDEIEDNHDVIDGDEEGEIEEPGMGDEFGDEGMGDDLGDGEGLEGRVMDLEDQLDELKAEFDALMAQEEGEGEHDFGGEDDLGGDDEGEPSLGDDEGELDATDDMGELGGDEDDLGDDDESKGFGEASVYGKSATETMREYVEKVTRPNVDSEGNEIGSGGKSTSPNKKSPTISGKNDMGGTTANILKGGSEQAADGKPTPKPSNAYSKGQKEVEGASSWENRPGANTKGYKDKKTAKTKEGSTTDDSVSVEKKSFNPGGKPGFKG